MQVKEKISRGLAEIWNSGIRPHLVGLILCSLILAVIYSLSLNLRDVIFHEAHVEPWRMVLNTCGLFVEIFVVLGVLCSANFRKWASRAADIVFEKRVRNVALITLLMILLWTPALYHMIPFYISPDTAAQLMWSQGMGAFDPSSRMDLDGVWASDHHPILDTLIYGAFYDLGEALGRAAYGIALLCCLQTLLCASVFAYMCCWMRQLSAPGIICFAAFLFWALIPMFPMLNMQVVKDITSMPFFLMWMMLFCDLVLSFLNHDSMPRRFSVALCALTLLCALMRKTLLYITVISLGLVLIAMLARTIREYRSRRRSDENGAHEEKDAAIARDSVSRKNPSLMRAICGVFLTCFVTLLVSLVLLPKMIFPIAGIAPGGPQESIAVPIQQVAAVVTEKGDELTEEQRAAIDAVLPYDQIPEHFTRNTSDPVKDMWKRDSTPKERMDFLKVWIELGMKYPDIYLNAVQYMGNYWTRGTYINDTPSVFIGWEEKGSQALFPEYATGYQSERQRALHDFVSSKLWAEAPIALNMLFENVTYVLWVPSFVFCLLLLIGRRNWMLLAPVFLSMAVLLVVPAFQPRYAFNLLFLAPCIVAIPYLVPFRERC